MQHRSGGAALTSARGSTAPTTAAVKAALAAAGINIPASTLSAAVSAIQRSAAAAADEGEFGEGGEVPELEGVELDAKALAKLEELEPEERQQLFTEYQNEASRKPIMNPSGWVFGRARTKVVDRLTGKGRADRRSSPY
mmetsp:Transcript_80088/g.221453  ORF Transcript_80088/g.221453 Transcript_80088/m.221453 type:complete len:139 (+) Transcript_80088:3-419(+)